MRKIVAKYFICAIFLFAFFLLPLFGYTTKPYPARAAVAATSISHFKLCYRFQANAVTSPRYKNTPRTLTLLFYLAYIERENKLKTRFQYE